jgi:hypothetical protein
MIKKPVEFVRNKDLLREINLSKASYCSYLDEKYIQYDYIVDDVNKFNDELIEQIIAESLTKKKQEKKLTPENIVLRVMTAEHIPLKDATDKQKKNSTPWKKTPFPPFKHYIMTPEGPKEVLRSHWVGGFDNGHFCITHGTINRRLARMMLIMVTRYAEKSNWRGYTYAEEMKGQALVQMSQVGLQFDESKSSNPFSYLTTCMKMCFTRILNIEKQHQHLRDDLLMMYGSSPSHTRQIEHEMEMKKQQEAAAAAKAAAVGTND